MSICRTTRSKVLRVRLRLGIAFTFGVTSLYNAFRKAWLWSMLVLCLVNKALSGSCAAAPTSRI